MWVHTWEYKNWATEKFNYFFRIILLYKTKFTDKNPNMTF